MWIELLLVTSAMAWEGNGNDWSWEETPVSDGFEINLDGFDDPAATEAAFQLTLDIWNAEGMATIYLPYRGTTDNSTYGGGDDGHNVTMYTPVTFSSALAQSRYNSIGDEMIDCDTEFYGSNVYGPKTWSTDPDGAAEGEWDFVHTAVHELGHCIGFSHSNVDGAIMGSTNTSGTGWERRHLQPDDIEGLQAMYGAGAPGLEVVDVVLTDADGDGLGQSGEAIDLFLTLRNAGGAPSVDVQGVISVADGPLTLVQDAADLGDLPPGAQRGTAEDGLAFSVAVDAACSDATEAELTLAVSDWIGGQLTHAVTVPLDCPAPVAPVGEDPSGAEGAAVGCGCASGGPAPTVPWLALGLLALRRRSSRSR